MPKHNTALFKSTFYEAVKQFATLGKRLRKGCSYLSRFHNSVQNNFFYIYIYIAPKIPKSQSSLLFKVKDPTIMERNPEPEHRTTQWQRI